METEPQPNFISYDDFKKLDIRVGTIRDVEPVPDTDKLLKCLIDFGEPELRQIVSGIHEFYPDYQKLVGKQVLYIVNLEPRMIKGVASNGMLLAVDGIDDRPVFLTPEVPVDSGAKIR